MRYILSQIEPHNVTYTWMHSAIHGIQYMAIYKQTLVMPCYITRARVFTHKCHKSSYVYLYHM